MVKAKSKTKDKVKAKAKARDTTNGIRVVFPSKAKCDDAKRIYQKLQDEGTLSAKGVSEQRGEICILALQHYERVTGVVSSDQDELLKPLINHAVLKANELSIPLKLVCDDLMTPKSYGSGLDGVFQAVEATMKANTKAKLWYEKRAITASYIQREAKEIVGKMINQKTVADGIESMSDLITAHHQLCEIVDPEGHNREVNAEMRRREREKG